mgnify:FL=1
MIKKTLKCEVKSNGYIISSTIEYRLFGILLYKKEYFYPPEGSRGEYFVR